jgi:tetratricopeptide (TPR) repeat protein
MARMHNFGAAAERRGRIIGIICFTMLLSLTWLAYHPGLSGGFLFDDAVNLDALGNSGRVDNWRTFWRFITSGTADQLGRPLALLSFLTDGNDWPTSPAPFLRTNVLLHLLNGTLLFALLRRLGCALKLDRAQNEASALLGAGMWMLHPLFVSTTLYIVQREAMLSATFILMGLLLYSNGRILFSQSNGRQGTALMITGIMLGTMLAILCKANGALLPLLAWTLEATVFKQVDVSGGTAGYKKRLMIIKTVFIAMPSIFIFAYIGSYLTMLDMPLSIRGWTIWQRLLTEPRVLIDYLRLLIVPRAFSSGLFNDDYIVSQGLLRPASTLLAGISICGAIAFGFLSRRRAPALAGAVLFFFSGHLLESSVVPLELYFEHRNYLPALLLFWPLAIALCKWNAKKQVRVLVAVSLLAMLAFDTHTRAQLWGSPGQLAAVMVKQNHESERSQANAAIFRANSGQSGLVLDELRPMWKLHPYSLQLAFNYISAGCMQNKITSEDKWRVEQALLHNVKEMTLAYKWIGNVIEFAETDDCKEVTINDAQSWVLATMNNPAMMDKVTLKQNTEPLLAQIALRKKDPKAALLHFNLALLASPNPDMAARQAAMLAEHDYFEEALAHLDNYERIKGKTRKPPIGMQWLHKKVLEWEGYWPFEMALLRKKLHEAIKERNSSARLGLAHESSQ